MLKTQNPFLCKGKIPTMSWLMEKNLLDQPIKMRTYDNIRKIATGQGDDNETGCKLDCPFFKKYYKMITINFSNNYWQCERNHFQFSAKNRNAIVNLFCLISRQNNSI